MKTNFDNEYKTDTDLEKNGVWFKIPKSGARFCLRRFGGDNASKVKEAMARFHKPYAKQIELGLLDDAKSKEIMAKIFVEACVIDWENVIIDGTDTKFDKDIAVKLFIALPPLFDTLFSLASDVESYKETLGNF